MMRAASILGAMIIYNTALAALMWIVIGGMIH